MKRAVLLTFTLCLGAAVALAETPAPRKAGKVDLVVTLQDLPASAVPGEDVTYAVQVSNLGPRTATEARLGGGTPAVRPLRWTCGPASEGASCASGSVDDELADRFDLPPGGEVVYTVTARVVPSAVTAATIRAEVTAGDANFDSRPASNVAESTLVLRPRADLAVDFAGTPTTALAGKSFTFRVHVRNDGPSVSPEVRLLATFPLDAADVVCHVPATGAACPGSAWTGLDEFVLAPGRERIYEATGSVDAEAADGFLVATARLVLPAGFEDVEAMHVVDLVSGEVAALEAPRGLGRGGAPDLVFDEEDRALVVFEQDDAGEDRVVSLRLDAGGAPLDEAQATLSRRGAAGPAVAFAPDADPGDTDGGDSDSGEEPGAGGPLAVWEDATAVSAWPLQAGRPRDGVLEVARGAVRPHVAARPQGGFLVVWQEDDGPAGLAILGRQVDDEGHLAGSPLRFDAPAGAEPMRPVTAADTEGFLVVWDRLQSSATRQIAARRLHAGGQLFGNEVVLAEGPGSRYEPAVTASRQGFYLVAWTEDDGIGGRLFDPVGWPQGPPFLLGRAGDRRPRVAAGDDGGYVVAWERVEEGTAVFHRIDGRGVPASREVRFGDSAERPAVRFAPPDLDPSVGETPLFFLLWEERREERELFVQRFSLAADLALSIEVLDPGEPGGDPIVYRLTVRNLGDVDAVAVTVVHELDPWLLFAGSAGCQNGSAYTECLLGTIPGQEERSYTLRGWIALGSPEEPLPDVLELVAAVGAATPDPDPSDNLRIEVTPLGGPGGTDLEVVLTPPAGRVEAGERVVFEATVRNAGSRDATGVVLHLEPSPGAVLVATEGCAEDPEGAPSCALGEVGVFEERRVRWTTEVGLPPSGRVGWTARVTSDVDDVDPGDDFAAASVEVSSADLVLSLEAPDAVTPGQRFFYVVTVTNTSGVTAVDTALTAVLPPALELVRWRGCDAEAEPARCRLDALAPGDSARVEVVVVVDSEASGELAFTLSALSPSVPGSSSATAVSRLLPVALRLQDGRFSVRVDYRVRPSGSLQTALALPHSETTGAFYFFDEKNVEVVVEVLDGGDVNGRFWVVHTGMTGLEYVVSVVDLETGAERTYRRPAGDPCGGRDRQAFPGADGDRALPEVPVPEPVWQGPGCTPGPRTLCLGGGRFRVDAYWWRTEQAKEGPALATAVTSSTGFFAFSNPEAPDLAVKLFDGRAVNDRFWFFAGSLSDAEYAITVTDVETGWNRYYSSPFEPFCGVVDIEAYE